MNKNVDFFSKGFSLANKSLVIFAILVILEQIPLIPNSFPYPLRIFSLILTFFTIGFGLSIPVFLQDKQNNRPIDVKHLILTTTQNTKRIALPFFLLSLFLGVALVILFLIKSLPAIKGWDPIVAIVSVLAAFFVFAPMFFSLEKEGLLPSFKHSMAVSFKHIPFVSLVMIIDLIAYSVWSYLSFQFFRLIGDVFILYVGFIVSASALYYYQRFIKRGV